MKCNDCNQEFRNGDYLGIRLMETYTGKKRKKSTLNPRLPIEAYHTLPWRLRVKKHSAGDELPLDCRWAAFPRTVEFFSEGVYYQGRIYPVNYVLDFIKYVDRLYEKTIKFQKGSRVKGKLQGNLEVLADAEGKNCTEIMMSYIEELRNAK